MGGTLAGHRRCSQSECRRDQLGLDALPRHVAAVHASWQLGVLPIGNHPAHDAAAEDVEQDMDVDADVERLGRLASRVISQDPSLVGARGSSARAWCSRVTPLIAPPRTGSNSRPSGTSCASAVAFIAPSGSRRTGREARARVPSRTCARSETHTGLAGAAQHGPADARASGPLTRVERSPWDPQRRHADLKADDAMRCRLDAHQPSA